jgi:hypothetical protein
MTKQSLWFSMIATTTTAVLPVVLQTATTKPTCLVTMTVTQGSRRDRDVFLFANRQYFYLVKTGGRLRRAAELC